MRFVQFVSKTSPGAPQWGQLDGDTVRAVAGDFSELLEFVASGAAAADDARSYGVGHVRFLVPAEPSKIVCVGLNYKAHAAEQGKALPPKPLIFLKPTTALVATGDPIELPHDSELVHHEGELAIVIGRSARHVSVDDAMEYVLGLTCMNDVSARDIQRAESRYTRGKGFDTFAPCGPVLAVGLDPGDLQLTTHVNGELRQSSSTSDMIFSVSQIVAFVSRVMTLLPGDIITTGTPSGVGPIEPGDTVSVEVEGVGVLQNPVVRDEGAAASFSLG